VDNFPSRERSAAATLEPRVSAIVVVEGKGEGRTSSLDLCFRSILAEPLVDELIVVDRGADPQTASALRALQADRRDVRVVSATKSKTHTAAANLGAENARGRFLLFLDPGVVLRRGAVARLASAGASGQKPWIAGGRLTDIAGKEETATRPGSLNAFSAIAAAFQAPSKRRRKKAAAPERVAAVSGAFMLLAREDFDTLRGFDEGFNADGADLDLCRRAAEMGGGVVFHPLASGVHFARKRDDLALSVGLARFASRSAKSPMERVFAAVAAPTLFVVLLLRSAIMGDPPTWR
jgi:hypothetical protein